MADDNSHTILFELPLPEDEHIYPVPRAGCNDESATFVRLPTTGTYEEIDEDGGKHTKQRWNLIVESLNKPIKSSKELENAIKSYNNKFASSWKFNALHELFQDNFLEEDTEFFFDNVMPKIISLALSLPALIKAPIPFLKSKTNHSISLSQQQAACILANAFLCTFPGRNGNRDGSNSNLSEINFSRLFNSDGNQIVEKIKCICNYFKRVCHIKMPSGVLTFKRRYIEETDMINWSESELKLSSIKLHVSSVGTIESHGDGMLQVDFANKRLGGGVLGWGCVQEEIRFVINPELIVGMLFCESMGAEEAILMIGCEQFNNYQGYSRSFVWSGNFNDTTPRDDFRRKMIYVSAIDALSFRSPRLQFEEPAIKRELNKAYAGFFSDADQQPTPVATGNWGCGVYRGNKCLKSLIQMMACCATKRNLVYFTFGERELMDLIERMFNFLSTNDITVGQLWSYLLKFKQEGQTNKSNELYQFIYDQYEASHDVGLIAGFDATDEIESNEKRKCRNLDSEHKDDDCNVTTTAYDEMNDEKTPEDAKCSTDAQAPKKLRIDQQSASNTMSGLELTSLEECKSEKPRKTLISDYFKHS